MCSHLSKIIIVLLLHTDQSRITFCQINRTGLDCTPFVLGIKEGLKTFINSWLMLIPRSKVINSQMSNTLMRVTVTACWMKSQAFPLCCPKTPMFVLISFCIANKSMIFFQKVSMVNWSTEHRLIPSCFSNLPSTCLLADKPIAYSHYCLHTCHLANQVNPHCMHFVHRKRVYKSPYEWSLIAKKSTMKLLLNTTFTAQIIVLVVHCLCV
jgi:hypothetical protein